MRRLATRSIAIHTKLGRSCKRPRERRRGHGQGGRGINNDRDLSPIQEQPKSNTRTIKRRDTFGQKCNPSPLNHKKSPCKTNSTKIRELVIICVDIKGMFLELDETVKGQVYFGAKVPVRGKGSILISLKDRKK